MLATAARVLVVLALLAGLFGLFVLDGANHSSIHSSPTFPADSSPDSPIVSAGPLEVTPPDHTLLRGPPIDPGYWDLVFMYAVSVVALCWTLARGVNRWRFDRQALAFEPREHPRVRPLAWIRTLLSRSTRSHPRATWRRD
ncbi:hypothetical protein [Natronobiforma cellulositropha]|uniref:hypothetical protein n=1 Tax=Natronobiforma cellulositropha TaxID=1679076 RepID=UPI0021D5A824|nr:hypothetical protein [Natronobiforma cellulositropha]